MATKRDRLQVLLSEDATERVKSLAKERGLSISAMLSLLVHAALKLPEFKDSDLESINDKFVKAAIEGGDIGDFKIAALLALANELKKD